MDVITENGRKITNRSATYTLCETGRQGILYLSATGRCIGVNKETIISNVLVGSTLMASDTLAFTRASSVIEGVKATVARFAGINRAAPVIAGIVVTVAAFSRTAYEIVETGRRVLARGAIWLLTEIGRANMNSLTEIGRFVTGGSGTGLHHTYNRSSPVPVGVKITASRGATFTRASSVIEGVVASATNIIGFVRSAGNS